MLFSAPNNAIFCTSVQPQNNRELSLFEKEQVKCLNKVMVQIEMSGTPTARTTGTGVLEAAVVTTRARRKVLE
jgi:hypothetical protein